MKNKLIILLSIFSCGFFQATDIFQAIESNDKKTINKWLKTGPDFDLVNDHGQTVLIKAVQVGNLKLVWQLLKKQKETVNVIDCFGRTALDYAVELDNEKIAKMLVKNQGMVTTESNAYRCKDLICSQSFLNPLL